MSRHGFHTFTTTAPPFAFDDADPFYDEADRAAGLDASRTSQSPAVPLCRRDPVEQPDTLIAR